MVSVTVAPGVQHLQMEVSQVAFEAPDEPVKVRVLSVDLERGRIGLSMKVTPYMAELRDLGVSPARIVSTRIGMSSDRSLKGGIFMGKTLRR